MAEFKHSKFSPSYESFTLIRKELLPGGIQIAFGISMADLSIMQADTYRTKGVDFDALSDALLEANKETKENMAFEYHGSSFHDIDTDDQTWFKF